MKNFQEMKVTVLHDFYDHTVTMTQTGSYCLAECIEYLQNFCGGFVWYEIETTAQELPKYANRVPTMKDLVLRNASGLTRNRVYLLAITIHHYKAMKYNPINDTL